MSSGTLRWSSVINSDDESSDDSDYSSDCSSDREEKEKIKKSKRKHAVKISNKHRHTGKRTKGEYPTKQTPPERKKAEKLEEEEEQHHDPGLLQTVVEERPMFYRNNDDQIYDKMLNDRNCMVNMVGSVLLTLFMILFCHISIGRHKRL